MEGGAQVQQVINIECLTDFIDAPLLNIKFRYTHARTQIITQDVQYKHLAITNARSVVSQTYTHTHFVLSSSVYKVVCVPLRYGGALQNISLKLPVTINKFFQPTEMAAADFFQRWKQLSQ